MQQCYLRGLTHDGFMMMWLLINVGLQMFTKTVELLLPNSQRRLNFLPKTAQVIATMMSMLFSLPLDWERKVTHVETFAGCASISRGEIEAGYVIMGSVTNVEHVEIVVKPHGSY